MKSILEPQSRKNTPVIAVVAGSGQIARCAVQGGADFLIVLSAVEKALGNKSRAAEALGITRKTLYSWLQAG